jgi:hypothetical protein
MKKDDKEATKNFEMAEGVLYRKTKVDGSYRSSLVVPEEMREEIMQPHHDAQTGERAGRKRALARMTMLCWWPHM